MTWRGIAPSGHLATIDISGGTASFKYEPPRGDVSGVIDNFIVIGLRGRPISTAVPVFGDVLSWTGSSWEPAASSGVAGSGVGPHNLLSSVHIDTTPASPIAGDLIAGSGGPATWVRFPKGLSNQQLRISDTAELEWAYDPIQIVTSGTAISLDSNTHRVVLNKTVAAPTTFNLPSSTFIGQEILIKDGKGDANANNITVISSGNTIDGFSQIIMRTRYQSVHFMWNGTEWNII